jgi:hypothetical protein
MNVAAGQGEPSLAITAAFLALVVAVPATAIAAVATASRNAGEEASIVAERRRRAAFGLVGWMVLTGAAAASGALASFERTPPPVMATVVLSWILTTVFAFSRTGGLVARWLPLPFLVGFHAFRLPLELILHRLYIEGVIPVQMTFDGMNFDIATGVTAIVVALWAATGTLPRAVLWLWNVMGLVLLLVIVTIAILSAPAPFRMFMNDPANTVITTFPFVWLPCILVQSAWLGHLLIFRRLVIRGQSPN